MAMTGLRMSTNEREFIEGALREEQRIDGRAPFDYRRLLITFFKEDGSVEVQLGQTRILVVVSGQLTQPYPDRPNEGSLAIFTEFSPMADPAFEPGRPSEMAVELGRIINRGLRESRAVDTESLCILAGRSVWAIRVDIHILDNGGNLVDAANLAALAGLLSYRRPECTVGGEDGQEIIVHPPEAREPLGLIIHHLPIAVTFAFFGDGNFEVLDPSLKEEEVMGSRLTITVNAQGEICAVQKGGGVGVSASELMRCLRIAAAKAQTMTETLKKAVEVHETERAQRKIRRHRNPPTRTEIATMEPIRAREVEMEDTPEAGNAATGAVVEDEARPVEAGRSGEGETEMEDAPPADEPPRGAGPRGGGLFAGGDSAWGDAKLTPLKGAPGATASVFPLDSDALVEFDKAAKALLRGGVSAQRKPPTEVVPASLRREISGQIAAAAVYASQHLPRAGEEGRPLGLGPIFPRVADVDPTEEGEEEGPSDGTEMGAREAGAGADAPAGFGTGTERRSEGVPALGKKKAKKRKGGGARED